MIAEGYKQRAPALSMEERSYGLDFARCVAISLVLLAHFIGEYQPADATLGTIVVILGFVGVELFFSLSGFLIGRILIRLAETGLTLRSVANFWARRWFRTLPAYYVCLLLLFWYRGMVDWPSVFFLQSFYPASAGFYIVSWSLVMEEYFYFSYPLLMLAVSFFLRPQQRVHLVAISAIAMILVWTAARWAAFRFHIPFANMAFHTHPIMRLDCCAYGVLAAYLSRLFPDRVRRILSRLGYRKMWGLLLLPYIAWAGIYLMLTSGPEWQNFLHFWAWGEGYFILQSSSLDALSAVLILFLLYRMPFSGTLAARAIGFIGRTSYSLYLTHPIVFAAVFAGLLAAQGPVPAGVESLALIGVASWLLYVLVERSFLKLRDRWLGEGRRVVAAVPMVAGVAQDGSATSPT